MLANSGNRFRALGRRQGRPASCATGGVHDTAVPGEARRRGPVRAWQDVILPVLLCLAGLAAASPSSAQTQDAGPPTVATKDGVVQGFRADGVAKFLGIPYGKPPAGALRWMPPVAREPWSGVRKATAYAPICAQSITFGLFAGPPNNNEDCLYLNVFTPTLTSSARLPVIVWIHGGGNVNGGTPGYDGSKLAVRGGTVVVSMAYRLNAMGWFAHPALDREGHPFGNYGVLDQQLALKWVQDNIARFGGDKNNVTVAGESSGALNAGLNVLSPMSAGLLHRAICQSLCPAPFLPAGPTTPLATAEARGVAFAIKAGCGAGTDAATARCLRNLSAADVEKVAVQGVFTNGQGIVDGQIVPILPMKAFATGRFNHMPIMNGNTLDEELLFLAIGMYSSNPDNALRKAPTAEQYLKYVRTTFGSPPYPAGTADAILARYPLSAYATPALALNRVGTDSAICGQRILDKILAPQVPVYTYEFADRTAPFYFPDMPGFAPLAYHTADIQYLFPGWHGGPDGVPHMLDAKQTALSDYLVGAWTKFARTGNPNGSGDTPWPRYTTKPSAPAWLIQNHVLSTMTDEQYAKARNCDLWEPLANYLG